MKQFAYGCTVILFLLLVSCAKDYSYEGGSLSPGYLVKDSAGACSLLKAEGVYKAGINLTDSNYLVTLVHVGNQGHYTIASDSINGYFFFAEGIFTDTGLVQIKIPAKGKPAAAGTNVFTLTYNSSACRTAVFVDSTPATPVFSSNPDYFPLTDSSQWVYDDLTFPGYFITNTVVGDTVIGSLAYKRIDEYKSFYPATNPRYYTKAGLRYLRYASVSGFTSALNFSPSLYDDFYYLKEGLTKGFRWQSNTYSGRTTVGVEVKVLRYSFTCLENDASLTVNNRVFAHVYKIQMIPEVADPGTQLQPTGEMVTLYYAKGIGLIYQERFNGVLSHGVLAIRSWKVR